VAFCGNCGNGIGQSAAFCNRCGQPQNKPGSFAPIPTYSAPSALQTNVYKKTNNFDLGKEFGKFFGRSRYLFFIPASSILISIPLAILFTIISGKTIFNQTFSEFDNSKPSFGVNLELIWSLIWFGKITITDTQFNKDYLGISLSGLAILSNLIVIFIFKAKNSYKLVDSKLDISRLLFGSFVAWLAFNIVRISFANNVNTSSSSYVWGLPHFLFLIFIFPLIILLIMSQDGIKGNNKFDLYYRILVRPFKLFVTISLLGFIFLIFLLISSFIYPNISVNKPASINFGIIDLVLVLVASLPSILIWFYSSGLLAAPLTDSLSPYPIVSIVSNSLNGYVRIYIVVIVLILAVISIFRERIQLPKSSESSNKNVIYFGIGTLVLHLFLMIFSFVWFGGSYISVPWQFIWGSPLVMVLMYAFLPRIAKYLYAVIPLKEFILGDHFRPHKSWELEKNQNQLFSKVSSILLLSLLLIPVIYSGISRFTWSSGSAENSAKNIAESIVNFDIKSLNSFLPIDKQLVLNDSNEEIIKNYVKNTEFKDLVVSSVDGITSANVIFLLDELEVSETINLVSEPSRKFRLFPTVSWTIQNSLPTLQGNRSWNSIKIDTEQIVMPGWYQGEIAGQGFQSGQKQLTAAFFDDTQVDVDLNNISLPAGWAEKSLEAFKAYLNACAPRRVEGNKIYFCGGEAETSLTSGKTISADYVTTSSISITKDLPLQHSQITKISCPANSTSCIDAVELVYESKFAATYSNTYVQVAYRGSDTRSTATFEGSGVYRVLVTLVMNSDGEININEIK
jgi:hypothetical protein